MENVFIILLVLFNFWTIWFFMREEKERCLPKEGKGEETKPPIDPYEFVCVYDILPVADNKPTNII